MARIEGLGGGGRDTAAADARPGSIARLLALLDALGDRPEGSRLSELARETGLPKSTLHRTLAEMRSLDVVWRTGHRYGLSNRFRHLAGSREGESAGWVRELVLPYLLEAYEETREAVHLCMLRGLDVVCVDRLHGIRSSAVRLAVGQTVRADGCAAGRVLLAYPRPAVRGMRAAVGAAAERQHLTRAQAGDQAGGGAGELARDLDAVRRRGFEVDRGGQYPGVIVAAAPVLDPRGVAVAAISMMGAAEATEPQLLARVAVAAARRASAAVRRASEAVRPGPAPRR
jgi:DNA-binding IclR family transcriptional regulator